VLRTLALIRLLRRASKNDLSPIRTIALDLFNILSCGGFVEAASLNFGKWHESVLKNCASILQNLAWNKASVRHLINSAIAFEVKLLCVILPVFREQRAGKAVFVLLAIA